MRSAAVFVLAGVAAATPALAQVPAGGEFLVNGYTTGQQGSTRVDANRAGDLVVAWADRPGSTGLTEIHGRRFTAAGAAEGTEFRADSADVDNLPTVALGGGGSFVVAWFNFAYGGPADIHARRFRAPGTPLGQEFQVNASTSGNQYRAEAAALPRGGYVLVWSHTFPQTGESPRILGRRYDSFGMAQGGEFVVNLPAYNVTGLFPSVAAGGDGRFVVAWAESGPASPRTIVARLYDPVGTPVGPQLTVGTFEGFGFPSVAMADDGAFVVAWETKPSALAPGHVWARVFSPAGSPAGGSFEVPSDTAPNQRAPRVASGSRGDFVVTWGRYGSDYDVWTRRFAASGAARGAEFRVNATTSGDQGLPDVASDQAGNFVVTWSGPDGSGYGVFAQRFGGLLPVSVAVDTVATPVADGNGVFDPGENVDFRPSWRNVNGAAQAFTGALASFTGPPGPSYTRVVSAANYGTVADGATGACTACYQLQVSAPSTRPAVHWDAVADEDLLPDVQGQRQRWRVHMGDSFADVARSSLFYRFVETLLHHGVTAGCGGGRYCPGDSTTRAQMSVFVLVARDRAGDAPPACTTPVFTDVPASSGFCRWIEELARSGVVSGCGGGNFCPDDAVTREQMAVFVLKTLDSTLVPPPCGTPVFGDVPASSPFCPWIEELARRGVVGGCGGGNYCPSAPVRRDETAVFIGATFGLLLYGP